MQNKKVLELDSFFGKLVACDEYVEIIPMYVTDSRKQGRKFYYQNISGRTGQANKMDGQRMEEDG